METQLDVYDFLLGEGHSLLVELQDFDEELIFEGVVVKMVHVDVGGGVFSRSSVIIVGGVLGGVGHAEQFGLAPFLVEDLLSLHVSHLLHEFLPL